MPGYRNYKYNIPEEFADVVGDKIISKNNNMQKVKSFFSWLVWSSMNNGNISLTLKGLIPFLVLWGISDTQTLNNLVGTIGNLFVLIGQTVAGLIAAWGLLRKVWLTMKHSAQ